MVLGAVAVDLLHALLDLTGGQVLTRRCAALAALDLGVLIGVHEDVQGLVVLQDDISAAAHDDAIAALGEVLQDLPLGHGHADGLVHDLEGGYAEPVADGQGIRGLYTLFGHVRHVVLIKAVFLGNHFDDLMVVAGDMQRLCQTLAQLTTAGAKFTADGDDTVHGYDLLLDMRSIFVAAAAHKFADDGVAGYVRGVQRGHGGHHIDEIGKIVLLHVFRRQLLAEVGDLAETLGQDAGLVVVE